MATNHIDIKDYYNHETRIALVENAIINMQKQFEQVEKRFEQVEKRFEQIDRRFERLEQKMDSQFRWIMGLILGLYGSGFVTMLGYFLKSQGVI
jgi:hypothetical protein